MTGKLVVRREDGTVETVAITAAIRIGSSPQSEVRIEGDGVLPLHANAGFEGGEYWIRDAGNAGVAINGERAAAKRTLRHLDVITVGSGVNVIFSTTAAPLPVQPRSKRPVPTAAAPPPPPKMTDVATRPEAPAPNTIVGPAPGVMPTFRPADANAEASNTIRGPAVPGAAPKFRPVADADAANTIVGAGVPGMTPRFRPADPEPESPNTIAGAAGPGVMPKFDPVSDDVEAAIPNTIVEAPHRGAVPKFEAAPSLAETVPQPGAAPPPPIARVKAAAIDRPITGVRFRGIDSVLNAQLGRSVIGRSATATLRINSDEVSKVHAVLDVTSTEVTLTDQKSVNGTAVNGRPTPGPRRLIEGDRVAFATFEFRVEFVRKD
jgi:pSer/pThr/pTyr-binding forkhead associated (FHA) protein